MKGNATAILFFTALTLTWGQQNQNTLSASHPIKVVAMLDQTRSTLSMRVQMPPITEFEPLLQLLANSGGEVAVGVVRDRSNSSLVRCRVDEHPINRAVPPDPTANVFLKQKQEPAYQEALAVYKAAVENWQNENQNRLAIFRRDLAAILARPIDASTTDINGAVRRADMFLAEPDEAWAKSLRRYAVYVTDGEDNVHAPASIMRSHATVLMVNGSDHLGTLATLKPIRMESFSAAVRYIIDEQKKEK